MQQHNSNVGNQPLWGMAAELAQGQELNATGRHSEAGLVDEGFRMQQPSVNAGRTRPQIPPSTRGASAFGITDNVAFSDQNNLPGSRHEQAESRVSKPVMNYSQVAKDTMRGDDFPSYGLALELNQNQGRGHEMSGIAPPQPRSRRALHWQLADAGVEPPQVNPHNQDHFHAWSTPVMGSNSERDLAASRDEEPDYGIIAELKEPGPPDPLEIRDFGLAAEVARRRVGRPSPVSGRYSSFQARPRKRLAASGPPADFGLAQEFAEREADMADPFRAANRVSVPEPFVFVNDSIKFPMPPLASNQLQDQEAIVQDPVPQKGPPMSHEEITEGGQQYGLADEISPQEALEAALQLPEGPSEELQRQQLLEMLEWEPHGHKYVYNEDTGMLHTTEGGEGQGDRTAKEYIEDVATGDFYKLNDPGVLRKLAKIFERKEIDEDDDDDDTESSTLKLGLKKTMLSVTNHMGLIGLFFQGLLAGYALISYFIFYEVYDTKYLPFFVQYFAPQASMIANIWDSLASLSVLSSVISFGRHWQHPFYKKALGLVWIDGVLIAVYGGVYLISVLIAPIADELTYQNGQDPRFFLISFNNDFVDRLKRLKNFNLFRVLLAAAAWILVCYKMSPYVSEKAVVHKVKHSLKSLKPSPPRRVVSNKAYEEASSANMVESIAARASAIAAPHTTISIRRTTRSARDT